MLSKKNIEDVRMSRLQPGEAAGGRDYAERLLVKFNKEIQNKHFGKGRDLSIEGNLVTFKKLQSEEATTNCFSFLSDGKIQNAAWTDLHMKKLISHLKEELGKLKRLYETTDGSTVAPANNDDCCATGNEE